MADMDFYDEDYDDSFNNRATVNTKKSDTM